MFLSVLSPNVYFRLFWSAIWRSSYRMNKNYIFFFIDTFVSLAIPSLQLRLTTSLLSNLDSTLKTNTQYLSIDQCRVLVLICSHILLRCLAQIPLALLLLARITTHTNTVPMAWSCLVAV
jgi:hypothetical protein